jgi:hypothetical protein
MTQPAASRRFWAQSSSRATSTPAPGQGKGVNRNVVYGLAAVGVLVAALVMLVIANPAFAGFGQMLVGIVVLGSVFGVVGFFSWKKTMQAYPKRRSTVIGVTRHALTVDERPGTAYPFRGATLGTWGMWGGISLGAALHLQSGAHRFVLGGRDYRPANGTRLDAANVPNEADVDAWVSESDFGEILEIAGLRHLQDATPPAPGSPIRCLLYLNHFRYQKDGILAQYKTQQYLAASSQPVLAIDIGAETVWAIDPNRNAFIGSSWRTDVTAIPTTYEPSFWSMYNRHRNLSIAPQMVVSGPSIPPLAIACTEGRSSYSQFGSMLWGASVRRFDWRGGAQVVREPAEYSVSAADWLALVGAFGLNEYLADHG